MDATSKHDETTIVHLLLPNCGLRTLQCNNYYLNNWIDLKHKWTKKKLVNLKKIKLEMVPNQCERHQMSSFMVGKPWIIVSYHWFQDCLPNSKHWGRPILG
jgi:hypothetical protein